MALAFPGFMIHLQPKLQGTGKHLKYFWSGRFHIDLRSVANEVCDIIECPCWSLLQINTLREIQHVFQFICTINESAHEH